MRPIAQRKKCLKILFIVNLTLLLLNGSALVFAIQSIDQQQTDLQYIVDTLPDKLNCMQICPPACQSSFQSKCCSSDFSQCMQKSVCKDNTEEQMRQQISNKYVWFYILFGLLGFFLFTLSLFVCFNKILIRRQRHLQLQRSQQALQGLIDYFSHISQILQAQRERKRSLLTQSLIESQESQQSCAICLDDFAEGKAVVLNCRHMFHKDCIGNWIDMKSNCPVCRTAQ